MTFAVTDPGCLLAYDRSLSELVLLAFFFLPPFFFVDSSVDAAAGSLSYIALTSFSTFAALMGMFAVMVIIRRALSESSLSSLRAANTLYTLITSSRFDSSIVCK
jgi:hypothetical protein